MPAPSFSVECARRSAATAARSPACGRTILRRSRSARRCARRRAARADRGRLLRRCEPGGRGQPQRRAHGALLAGLPESVAGVTVNRLCASGLAAVSSACHAVIAGDGDLFVAGGAESMSRAPFVMGKPETALPRGDRQLLDTTLGWRFVNPKLAELFPPESMGETGENVAERWDVSREDQDAFALASQQRWAAAAAAGRFDDELVAGRRRHARRAPASGHDAGEARRAEAGLPRGRHRHRRQRVGHQRRRRRARDRVARRRRASSASSRSARSSAARSPASTRA